MRDGIEQGTGAHLLLYDGACGFCNRMVRFVLAHDRRGVFRFAALQGAVAARELGRLGGLPQELGTFQVIEDYRGDRPRLLRRSAAACMVATSLGWPWRAAAALQVLPAAWLDAAYDVVARHRHQLAGRRDACPIPTPDHRARFLDAPEALR